MAGNKAVIWVSRPAFDSEAARLAAHFDVREESAEAKFALAGCAAACICARPATRCTTCPSPAPRPKRRAMTAVAVDNVLPCAVMAGMPSLLNPECWL